MSSNDGFPWFPCYPTKLLGALAGMKPHEGYLYWIVCLRIYEIDGPCSDSTDALVRRSGLKKALINSALECLFKSGKLVKTSCGIMNPFAEKVLESRKLPRSKIKSGDSRLKKKDEMNQSNGELHLDIEVDSEKRKGKSLSIKADGWPADYAEVFWSRYPRKIGKAKALIILDRVKKSGVVGWAQFLAGLEKHTAWAATKEIQYVKHPTTWLNGEHWNDQLTKGEFKNGTSRQGSGGGFAHNLVDAATGRADQPDQGPEDAPGSVR